MLNKFFWWVVFWLSFGCWQKHMFHGCLLTSKVVSLFHSFIPAAGLLFFPNKHSSWQYCRRPTCSQPASYIECVGSFWNCHCMQIVDDFCVLNGETLVDPAAQWVVVVATVRRHLDDKGKTCHAILTSSAFPMQITLSCCSLFSRRRPSQVDFLSLSVRGNCLTPVKSTVD